VNLKLNNISVKAGSFYLKDVSLEIATGSYHALIGPSGAGKSLLLSTIAGFMPISSGEIIFDNKFINKLRPEQRDISILFQELALFPNMNVLDNVAFPMKMKKIGKVERNKKVQEYLEICEIAHISKRSIQKLSGGEKQRVALARCLAKETNILLLDEPLAAIDSSLKKTFIPLLQRISDSGKTILHVSHYIKEIESLAQKVSIIKGGRIEETISTRNLFVGQSEFLKDFTNSSFKSRENTLNTFKLAFAKPDTESDYIQGTLIGLKYRNNEIILEILADIIIRISIKEDAYLKHNIKLNQEVYLVYDDDDEN
jgi:molybdate transport system ATP-binding protein